FLVVCSALGLAGCKGEVPAPPPVSAGTEDAAGKEDAAVSPSERPAPDAARDASQKRDTKPDLPVAPDAFFGESRCPANVMLCDDFEGNALDPAKWMPDLSGGNTWGIDNTVFARGKGSLNTK